MKYNKKNKIENILKGAEKLSLGISIAIAILMGTGIGIWLKNIFHSIILLWIGILWGIAAALLNIIIEYKKLKKELDEVANDPKYKNYKIKKDEEDDILDEYE